MRYRHGSSPSRAVGRSRFVFLLSMFAIFASLLMPVLTLTATDAAAQGVPPDCDPGYVVSDDQTSCVPDPNQGGTETVTPTETATATETQTVTEVDPTYVYIDKFDCPTDTDWSTVTDLATFAQGCPPNQTPVMMAVNGEQQPVTASGQWGPIQDPSSVSISEEVDPNYNLPRWFCGTYASGGQPALSDFGASASVMPTVAPGESVYCQVFNTQQPTEQYGTVILHKYACPDGYSFGDPTQASIDQLQQECQQPLGGVSFNYEQNGQAVQQLVTDQSGMAQWDQAPVGPYTLREQLPFGYGGAVVHCSYHEANQGNFVGQSQPVLMDDPTSWSGTMEAGYVLDCYVFNIPNDQLQLVKHWCAPDFTAPENATEQDYQGCAETPGAQITWRVALQGNDQEITSLQPDANGYAGYVGLEQNQPITILEQLPDGSGYGALAVYCAEYQRGGNGQPSAAVSYDPATGLHWTPRDGYFLACDFYNVAEGGAGQAYGIIQIEKYWCNEGYQPAEDAPQSDVMGSGQCQAEGGPTTLSLDGPGGPYDPMTVPDNGNNVAQWELTEGGTYTVTEDVPDGYQMLAYCHTAPLQVNGDGTGQTDPQRQTIMNGNQIQWEAQEGFYWVCAIFNLQVDDNSVTVYKWQCEPGTEYGRELEYYQGGLEDQDTGPCETVHENVTMHLIDGHPDSPREGITSHNTPEWDGVVLDENGSFQIQETIPGGYGDPMVFCQTLDDEQSTMVPATGGLVTITPASEPFTYQCNWYNIPTGGGNWIDFYKYVCTYDTPTDQDYDYYLQNCQPRQDWPFDVDWGVGGETLPTDQNGVASWDGVPQGTTWTGSETLDAGWGTPLVWCRYVEWPDEANYTNDWFVTNVGVNGAASIQNSFEYEGVRIECYWFNFEPEQTGNSITLYKWQCEPGTEYGRELEYYQGGLPDQDTGPCETEHMGVTFTVVDGAGSHPKQTVHNTTWDNVVIGQEGEIQLIETIPPGYGEPMVWCWTNDGDPQQVDATNGFHVVQPGAEEPWNYYCNWYNIPYEGEYQFHLYKYTCDETVDRTLGLPDLGSNPSCAPAEGVSFTASFGMTPGSARYTDANGEIHWLDVPGGPWSLTEGPMAGYQAPRVFCGPPESGEYPEATVTDGTVTGTLDSTTPQINCYWFNFEEPVENGWITVLKYQCPPGTTATDFGLLGETCTTPHNGIGFTLAGPGGSQSASTAGGRVDWTNLDQGDYTVTETTVLPGYLAPIVFCGIVLQDGAPIDPGSVEWMPQTVTDQAISLTLDNFPKRIVCYWYNIPEDYGEITIYKWTCPAGYDLSAWGADPKVDCTEATNGVTFTLTPPAGPVQQSDTGDSIPGAVYFGGLDPGSYTVTETVPANTKAVFVLNCTGTDLPKVHQVPLSWGPTLDITVSGGDSIVCHWYNVPRPETGWVTVHKYVCSTKTFVDKVYCVTYEKGQAFELFGMPGQVSQGVGITNAGGTYTWTGLAPGAYTIREDKGVPCKMTADKVDGTGNAWVAAGEGTRINVYNCSSTPGKVPPGKPPVKYPNTGVGPDAVDSLMPANLPALQGEPASSPSAEDEAASEAFYQVDCISGEVPAGTPVPATPDAEATMPPIEAEPTEPPADAEATETPPATPEVAEGECVRGAVPTHLSIESIGVDANVEYLEIVDGLMEQPTGASDVAWYRDTARLGETNNVVMAGHLNWWNVPEGVFYRLQDMQEGDRIEVTGDDGMVYIYEVRTVTQESNLEPPGIEVIGPTDEPTLTLITCGGAWNADIAEYDQRTVVRAVQVDVQPVEQAGS